MGGHVAKRREKWRIETKVRLQSNRYVLFLESNDDELINRLSLSFSLSSLSPRTQRQQQNRRWSISWRTTLRSFQSCRKRKARECSSLDVAEATRWKRSVRLFLILKISSVWKCPRPLETRAKRTKARINRKRSASWRTSLRTTISTTLFTIARSYARYNLRRDTCGLNRCEISPRKVLA